MLTVRFDRPRSTRGVAIGLELLGGHVLEASKPAELLLQAIDHVAIVRDRRRLAALPVSFDVPEPFLFAACGESRASYSRRHRAGCAALASSVSSRTACAPRFVKWPAGGSSRFDVQAGPIIRCALTPIGQPILHVPARTALPLLQEDMAAHELGGRGAPLGPLLPSRVQASFV